MAKTMELGQWAIQHRRYLHENPELSGQEFETCRYIKNELTKLNVELLPFNEPNVVGYIAGAVGEKTILLRADIDALPIQEEGEGKVAFSKVPGVSHACGHDGHTSILLAVTKWISENRHLVPHNIVLVFQSSEEMPPSGAEILVKEGVLNNVDLVLGLHLMSSLEKGVVGIKEGPIMASSDDFDITILGHGGHGSAPHETVDASYIAGQLIVAMQSIVSRRIKPIEPAVISVGQLQGGSNYNIIPNEMYMNGTFRTFSETTREFIMEELAALSVNISKAFGGDANITFIEGTPPVINDVEVTKQVESILKSTLKNREVKEIESMMGAEDFAFYLQQCPGNYLIVGMGGEKSAYPHHHPNFDIDEEEIETAIQVFVELIKNYKFD